MQVTNRFGEKIEVGPDMDLHGADLCWSDLRGADFRWADLSEANLRGADFSNADLSGADLSGADLLKITLCGATIDGARVRNQDIGGPGYILCALTDSEWEWVQQHRGDRDKEETAT